jgi:hypothetical protein
MIEIIPDEVETAFLYFHTRCSAGDEIAPFTAEVRAGLPKTYIWAGDGPVEGAGDDPVMGKGSRTNSCSGRQCGRSRGW